MTLLLLAGTGEAQRLATALAAQKIPAIASLAGVTRAPKGMAIPTRSGGFGGANGFRGYIAQEAITAVLDATHPFAAQITNRTAEICADLDLPYCQILRPEWCPEDGDKWSFIDDEDQASAHIAPGSTVFLATGRQTLHRFANLEKCRLICRQIDPPDEPFPFDGGEFLIGRPPFTVEDEHVLFKELAIDWLVVKNAGGAASRTKLTAAGQLGIPVLMINRPKQPDAPCVNTIEDALSWVMSL